MRKKSNHKIPTINKVVIVDCIKEYQFTSLNRLVLDDKERKRFSNRLLSDYFRY